MRATFSRWLTAAAVLLGVSAAGCSAKVVPAGLEVLAESDLAKGSYGSIWIEVAQEQGADFKLIVDEQIKGTFPARFAIAPGSSADQDVLITVTAYATTGTSDAGARTTPIVQRIEQVQVPRGYVGEVDLVLSESPAACPGAFTLGSLANDQATICRVNLGDAAVPVYKTGTNTFDASYYDAHVDVTTANDSGHDTGAHDATQSDAGVSDAAKPDATVTDSGDAGGLTVTRYDDENAGTAGQGPGNPGDLRYAMLHAAVGGTIALRGKISLNGPLPPIVSDVTIDGQSQSATTIEGQGLYRVFFADRGAVTIKNLTISNALAQGGNGGNGFCGGGGGLGAGAGLFVDSAAVTLSNVSFVGMTAQGGNGGVGLPDAGAAGAGGGGGGGLTYAGGDGTERTINEIGGGGGGGGVLAPGVSGNADSGAGGAGGAGGGGAGASGDPNPTTVSGGAGYADAASGQEAGSEATGAGGFCGGGGGGSGGMLDNSPVGANGGIGGGGGGNGAATSTLPPAGESLFGGGGGGGGGGPGVSLVGDAGGGRGGATPFSPCGGGGGAALGPAIFNFIGHLTLDTVSFSTVSATGGAGGKGGFGNDCNGTAGSVVPNAMYNFGGSVNGNTTSGPADGG